ncbi:MAG: hypothetical protein JXQ66_01790 [Campylobacterales bacterium]|nr:hypothetical protein [Campylobacterales bacterium]
MAKKKKTIDMSDQNITFTMQEQSFKVIRFNPSNMTLDVMISNDGVMKKGLNTIPFAHIPKEIKKLIKPN